MLGVLFGNGVYLLYIIICTIFFTLKHQEISLEALPQAPNVWKTVENSALVLRYYGFILNIYSVITSHVQGQSPEIESRFQVLEKRFWGKRTLTLVKVWFSSIVLSRILHHRVLTRNGAL